MYYIFKELMICEINICYFLLIKKNDISFLFKVLFIMDGVLILSGIC